MSKSKAKWCVYASSQTDAVGADYAFGDGVTASTCRVYAICDGEDEARRALSRLRASKSMRRTMTPGDGRMRPDLAVAEFDPLDFVGRQNRDEYHGQRLARLVASLYESAARNAAALEG
jgi:hypothetical protein